MNPLLQLRQQSYQTIALHTVCAVVTGPGYRALTAARRWRLEAVEVLRVVQRAVPVGVEAGAASTPHELWASEAACIDIAIL